MSRYMNLIGQNARKASFEKIGTKIKNKVLKRYASLLKKEKNSIFNANKKEQARTIKYDSKYLDNVERIKSIKDFDTSVIKCKWQVKRKVQISHTGEVFPCCYFLSDRWPRNPESPYAKDVASIEWLNVNDLSLEDILNSEWFATYLPESWNNENRYDICSKVCGT